MWLQLLAAIASFQLFVILSVHHVTFRLADKKEDEPCSQPFSCGEVKEIRYPFKLQGSECQGYPLICQDNTTLLLNLTQYSYDPRFQGIYHVKKISIDSGSLGSYISATSIQIIDPNFASNDSSTSVCQQPRYPMVGDVPSHAFLDSATVTWVKCRNARGNGQLDPATYLPLPCPYNNNDSSSSSWQLYLLFKPNMTVEQLDRSCQVVAGMPVVDDDGGMEGPNLTAGRILSRLQMGFRMTGRTLCDFCDRKKKIDGCFLRDCVAKTEIVDLLGTAAPQLRWAAMLGIMVFGIVPRSLGVLFLAGLLIYKLKKRHSPSDAVEKVLQKWQNLMPRRYSYSEIKIITGRFAEKLGRGGFGTVFKGTLFDGRRVAVKLLTKAEGRGEDFINEVATIGRIHHVNIVRLLGFCSEGSRRALIYEFMPNGSLDRYVFAGNDGTDVSLSWEMLYKIALGVARGIEYLHRGCDVCILHFDIKPHNVLLDANFCPKISDFGSAKVSSTQNTVTLTGYRGTIGYIAPEQVSRSLGGVSYKSDVYSFGMLLLRMAERIGNGHLSAPCSGRIYFPAWIHDRLSKGQDVQFGEVTEIEEEIVKKLAVVGLFCVQMVPANRPSMSQVIEMLEGSSDALQLPPKACFMFPDETYDEESPMLPICRSDVGEVPAFASSSDGVV
ncbi:unnamed protein product [Victoria cruziana]